MPAKTFDTEAFRKRLEETQDFPALYMFKFIVPEAKKEEVEALFPLNEVTFKPSSKGNYTSVTAKVMVPNTDFVIDIYQKAHTIEGIIAL